MRERAKPTHVLRVEVPLDLSERSVDFDAVSDALGTVLAISRAAMSGEICDEIIVNAIENPTWPPEDPNAAHDVPA